MRCALGSYDRKWQIPVLPSERTFRTGYIRVIEMAATLDEISKWFDRGVEQKAKHMLVICDTFDYEDYPVFTNTDYDCLARYKAPGEMQRVVEVYDLTADKAAQMIERRSIRLPALANVK
jgi:hypothetical protein